ncbi:mucin-5AC-like [Corticium candelabrum]|uniref:mucin-5AC-like n=1 Tax=Corticium candelabrum TaxID=121492 RepID=UPI002E25F4D4|nr:mucin-5AC-like [Corticium candelabrum]
MMPVACIDWCPRTCRTHQNPGHCYIKNLCLPGCDCPSGTWFDPRASYCVEEGYCKYQAPTYLWPCESNLVPVPCKDECPPTCQDPFSGVCKNTCVSGCECPKPLLYDSCHNKCVHFSECSANSRTNRSCKFTVSPTSTSTTSTAHEHKSRKLPSTQTTTLVHSSHSSTVRSSRASKTAGPTSKISKPSTQTTTLEYSSRSSIVRSSRASKTAGPTSKSSEPSIQTTTLLYSFRSSTVQTSGASTTVGQTIRDYKPPKQTSSSTIFIATKPSNLKSTTSRNQSPPTPLTDNQQTTLSSNDKSTFAASRTENVYVPSSLQATIHTSFSGISAKIVAIIATATAAAAAIVTCVVFLGHFLFRRRNRRRRYTLLENQTSCRNSSYSKKMKLELEKLVEEFQ